jgi:hypothetical protein
MMRWEYPDPSDAAEAGERQRVAAAMDAWWRAFAANADNLDAAFSRKTDFDIAGFTNEHLNPIVEGLCWEYGPAIKQDGHRLVITPEGLLHLRPMVRELLRRAPQVPRWEFYLGRLPERPETAFPIAEQIAKFKPTGDVLVKASLGKFRRVDLTFHVPGSDKDKQAANHWTYRATEQLLGEDVLDRWLGAIDVAPPQPRTKRLFGGKPAGVITAAER